MTMMLQATFDGTVLLPDEPLALPANTRVKITVETTEPSTPGASFLDTALSLSLEGPPDWSDRFEEYLYRDPGK